MRITKDLKKQIESDIAKCESYSEVKGSEQLYGVLVARYTVLDTTFGENLPSSGKTASVNQEFDFRPELRAIAAKLQMWLLTVPTDQEAANPLKDKVDSFIKRGETIKQVEFQPATEGFPVSFVSGPRFDKWMGEIYIFNERYLKDHPLHDDIRTTYYYCKQNPSSCDEMLGHLRALETDEEFFRKEITPISTNSKSAPLRIQDMLAEDIALCEQFVANPTDEKDGRKLYTKVTSRYDRVIDGFGYGLYQYTPELHLYDPDIDSDTLGYNLQVLVSKMQSYYAQNFATSQLKERNPPSYMSNKVFIVHGHDEAAKQTMARTLEHAGFEAIILHEQPNSGKTIVEKIEAYTDVAFSVVLYTECDVGRAKDATVDAERNRARQNVVFEHGYLIGRLGRTHVCALVKGDVETPGDISGVVYIHMDDGGAWKTFLAKEMKAAGLAVDLNKFLA